MASNSDRFKNSAARRAMDGTDKASDRLGSFRDSQLWLMSIDTGVVFESGFMIQAYGKRGPISVLKAKNCPGFRDAKRERGVDEANY